MKINKPNLQNIYHKLRKYVGIGVFSDPYFPVQGQNIWSLFPRTHYEVQVPLYLYPLSTSAMMKWKTNVCIQESFIFC